MDRRSPPVSLFLPCPSFAVVFRNRLGASSRRTPQRDEILCCGWLRWVIATPAEKTVLPGPVRSSPSRYRLVYRHGVGQAPPPDQSVTHHATALRMCRALLRKALHWQTPLRARADTETPINSLQALISLARTRQTNVAHPLKQAKNACKKWGENMTCAQLAIQSV